MPIWMQWTLIAAGSAAIVFLVGFIVRQWRTLSQGKTRRQKLEAFQQARRTDMIESIRVLAMSVEQNQIEYSEACLRIKGLLDHVNPELLDQAPYRIFQEIHDQIEHMPTHRARQQTDARFVRKMDRERLELELTHADAIRRAATAIRYHKFPDD